MISKSWELLELPPRFLVCIWISLSTYNQIQNVFENATPWNTTISCSCRIFFFPLTPSPWTLSWGSFLNSWHSGFDSKTAAKKNKIYNLGFKWDLKSSKKTLAKRASEVERTFKNVTVNPNVCTSTNLNSKRINKQFNLHEGIQLLARHLGRASVD